MPDLPTIAGGPSDAVSTPASTTGVAIAAHSSTNTKATSWTELLAATTYDCNWVQVMLSNASNGGAGYAVDIGVGTSTAEQVLIPNLYYNQPSSSTLIPRVYLFPLRIPKATRLSARCQSTTGSATLVVTMQCIASPISAPPGLDRVEACGMVTSSFTKMTLLADAGASAHTDSTWGQLIASTGFCYKWACVALVNTQDVNYGANHNNLVDFGVGGSGAEFAFINDLMVTGGTNEDTISPGTFCFPVATDAGVRLSARYRDSVATAGDRRLEVALWGAG